MFSNVPVITETGMTLLLRAAGGETITLTKMQAGSGVLEDGETPKTMTGLKNAVLTNITITQAEGTEDDGYIMVTGSFDNQTDVQSDFRWTELGVIAEDSQGNEYLYAYAYDDEYADLIKAGSSDVVAEQTVSVILAIGDSENITVYVLPHETYATAAEFNAHLDATNPHSVTYAQTGAAAATHTHSASDIASGTLPIARGGTGATTADGIKSAIGLNYVFGTYDGNGASRKDITLGFEPTAVYLWPLWGGSDIPSVSVSGSDYEGSVSASGADPSGAIWFGAENNVYRRASGDSYKDCSASILFNAGYGGGAVTATGFAVGYSSSGVKWTNANGKKYLYMAVRA